MNSIVKSAISGAEVQSAWLELTRNIPLSRIHNQKQYRLVVKAMEYLADLVNDDAKDNRFYEEIGRFPEIDEDVKPYRLLVNDYEKYL